MDGAGGSIFVWQDKRGSGFDIYAHHIYNNGTYVKTASLEHENDSEISIFPNPSSFDFSISGIIWNTLEVVDAFGRTVMVVQNNAPTVDISNLSNGIYSIHINSKDNKMFTKRLEILK